MKSILSTIGLAILGFVTASYGSDKRTADYFLTSPVAHEGEDITVDVAFVKPIHWTSPFPEIAFFHSVTIDRSDYKAGGTILVAVPAKDAEAFAKKYGTDMRRDADALKGKFLSAGSGGPGGGGKIWLLDTTGQLTDLIAQRKLEIPREVAQQGGGRRPGLR